MSDQPLLASVDTAVAPAPGYYPDPSVPGFVRYWNGGTWVPGTSRPAPADGEVLVAPRFAARPAVRPNARYIPPPAMPEAVPATEPATATVAATVAEPETGPVFLDQTAAGAVFRMAPEVVEAPVEDPPAAGDAPGWQADPQAQRGLMETGTAPRWVSWGQVDEVGAPPALAPASAPASAPAPAPAPAPALAPAPRKSAQPTSRAASALAALPGPAPRKSAQPTSRAASTPASAPAPALASARRKRVPARAAAPAPAGYGRRLVARLVDSAVSVGVAAAVVLPLLPGTVAHLRHKLDQARLASHLTRHETQVWLVDGVVLGRVALLIGVLLLAGLVYEVLPTSRTGRTLGKRLAGLRVVGPDGHRPPAFGRSLVRWLVRQLTVLTVVGLLAVLFDRQQRRGWADRAARTKVVRG